MARSGAFLPQLAGGLILMMLIVAGCGAASGTSTGQTWQEYQSRRYNFQIAIPSSVHLLYAISGASANENPIWGNADKTLQVLITTTTGAFPGPAFCSEGTAITVGPGIHARQVEHFTVPATQTPGSSGPRQPTLGNGLISVSAQFVSGGVAIYLQLAGTPPASTFFNRYGATWNHMLASFKPGAAVGQLATCA